MTATLENNIHSFFFNIGTKGRQILDDYIIFRIQSSMSSINRQGTFWVIGGVRVKKKQPYIVTSIDRVLHVPTPKNDKHPEPHVPANQPTIPIGQRYFFTEKSYEDFADKRVDYGMIRFSSLSSLKGDIFWGQHHEGQHNFSAYNSTENMKQAFKKTIFENQFSVFQYIDEVPQEDSENQLMKS